MSSQSASHALRCHRSQGRRGRSVSRILRQPPPPVHRGSSTTAPPSKTLLTLSQTLFTLIQKGLTSRGEFLGRRLRRYGVKRASIVARCQEGRQRCPPS